MTADIRRRSILAAALAVPVTAALAACTRQEPAPRATAGAGAADEPAATAPSPAVASVEPAALSVSGGQTVTLAGTGLAAATAVMFAGTPGTDLQVAGDGSLTVVAPRSSDYEDRAADVQVMAGDAALTTATAAYAAQTPVDRQLQYALAHWDAYNLAEYGDFNPSGGDCVNFVSQTLIQRGWEMTTEWHNRGGGSDWTYAWIHVPTFDRWLAANATALGITRLELADRDRLKVGDIVIFDWNRNASGDHTQIISAIEPKDGGNVVKMVGHNLDNDYRDLDETITTEHPGAEVHFWSVA
ncbi:plastocyanin [Clavibacter sp. B3I6]|uniref:amidase domain-containing protein n=1 Tax=Clavibacter sp. B3I6 TaxID=3042268 RepID=UPI0027881CBF|nr:amidase domain-containing protein [Clavibacter sp. B3I6]MDQ0744331.1 plastocyanin [Clavibacter sp. B3I6]